MAVVDGGPVYDPLELLTAEEVAARLKVPVRWVYAEARAGRLPKASLGPSRYVRFRRVEIERYLSGG